MRREAGPLPEDARIGTRIAGYRIDREIGRGGMSVVYLAEHLRLGRNVALKVLAPQLAENEKFRDRFLRESKIAASIDHPNIVPIYDADEDEGTLYIAMRYVEGTDLHALLREQGRLDPPRVARLVTQVGAALDAAHANDLVHRDVKPGNVLLTADDHVYLSDFGLTKRALSVSGLTETGQLVGTLDYVAPEQIKGDPVDPRADVYSLGCIVYECLTGQIPYPRDMEVAVLWAHVQDPPPLVTAVSPEFPHEVDDVVTHAMAKDPEERTPTAGAVATELRAALGLEATGALPVTRPLPKPKARPRARVILPAVVVLALVAVAVAAIVLRGGGGEAGLVPAPDTVARIDAATLAFEGSVGVGENPIGVTLGDGSVWVINQADQTVQRIDPATGEVLATKASLGTPTGIAYGEDAVWITNGYGSAEGTSQVVRVNPADDSVRSAFETPGAKAIVVAFGSVWLADENGDRVLRYDPATGERRAAIKLPDGSLPSYLAVGTGASEGIWVVNDLAGTVSRIDPTTDEVVDRLSVDAPYAVAADDRGVWVSSNANDSLVRIDPETGITIETLSLDGGNRIPNGPTTIALSEDWVWLASNLDPVVVRIDPATNQVVGRLDVAGIADGMAVDETGNVWATVHAP
ncbi:MAG TPA: protein kinase [Actinomycetota bacterium]|nr:protein kinase [Actinomycetota bacterium]